jgi:hypothetical protein
VPLSVPITLSPGHFQSPEFKIWASLHYRINIAFDSGIPLGKLDCLIGNNIESVQPCTGEPPILDVKWRVLSRGQVITTGSSSEHRRASYSYHKVQKFIGGFDGQGGQSYFVQVDILQDGSRLALANPKLEVEPILNAYEGRLLLAGLAFYIGLLAAAIGVTLTLIAIIRERRKSPIARPT